MKCLVNLMVRKSILAALMMTIVSTGVCVGMNVEPFFRASSGGANRTRYVDISDLTARGQVQLDYVTGRAVGVGSADYIEMIWRDPTAFAVSTMVETQARPSGGLTWATAMDVLVFDGVKEVGFGLPSFSSGGVAEISVVGRLILDEPAVVAGDMNGDGAVNGLDVGPFVEAVVGDGSVPVPESATLTLATIALLGLLCWRRKER